MTTGDALLRRILEVPDDDTARRVYADWLQENGREQYATHIRGQVERPSQRGWFTGGHDSTGWYPHTHECGDKSEFCVHRGFVCEIHLPLAAFMQHAETLFRAHPIERVTLTDRRPLIERVWYREDGLVGATPDEAAAGLPAPLIEFGHRTFRTRRAASKWLSWRCVDYGRGLAGLPALPGKEPGRG